MNAELRPRMKRFFSIYYSDFPDDKIGEKKSKGVSLPRTHQKKPFLC